MFLSWIHVGSMSILILSLSRFRPHHDLVSTLILSILIQFLSRFHLGPDPIPTAAPLQSWSYPYRDSIPIMILFLPWILLDPDPAYIMVPFRIHFSAVLILLQQWLQTTKTPFLKNQRKIDPVLRKRKDFLRIFLDRVVFVWNFFLT